MPLNPRQLAIEYYFGDLQYWKIPQVAADALELGYDGPALRRLAGVYSPIDAEMDPRQVDSAFKEMGVDAPISKDKARLVLAAQSISNALGGSSNVFDAATHIRVHLCESSDPPEELHQICELAKSAKHAPRSGWKFLEQDLREAFAEFLERHKSD